MTTSEALAAVREALDRLFPRTLTTDAFAALALIEERLEQTDEVLAFLRHLIESEWGQSGPYTGSFEVVNEFVRALGGGEPSPQAGDLLVMPHTPGDPVPVGWTVEGDKMWRRADGTEAGRALGGGE